MTKFDIEASKLKHAITVLQRVNDEGCIQINSDGLVCRIVDAANAIVVQATLPCDAFDTYIAPDEPQTIGLNLDRFASWLKRAAAKDIIHIDGSGSYRWYLTRGIHQRGMALLDADKIRKAPKTPELSHTAAVTLSGKEFKEIVAEAEDLGKVTAVVFHATAEEMIFSAESEHVKPETYKCVLPQDRFELCPDTAPETHCLYGLDYLQDIATDMRATDEVRLKFSTNMPCEIEYERNGVKIEIIQAPRIESD